MKIVLDTNVLISAIVFGGNPERLLYEIHKGTCVWIASPALLLEFATTLHKKLHWSDTQIAFAVNGLDGMYTLVKPTKKIYRIKGDRSDNAILECAIAGNADYIVSGDKKHVLPLKKFRNIYIVSPADFLKKVLDN